MTLPIRKFETSYSPPLMTLPIHLYVGHGSPSRLPQSLGPRHGLPSAGSQENHLAIYSRLPVDRRYAYSGSQRVTHVVAPVNSTCITWQPRTPLSIRCPRRVSVRLWSFFTTAAVLLYHFLVPSVQWYSRWQPLGWWNFSIWCFRHLFYGIVAG